jgi:mRNA-degrading endonuclease YafQ of YafQ-DinJ toxin-antitoxin module
VTGSNPFSIEPSENFQRSLKPFKKSKGYRDDFAELLSSTLENLMSDPYPRNSRQEPLPGKLKLPDDWTFHKLEFKAGKGASGQVRLMYGE